MILLLNALWSVVVSLVAAYLFWLLSFYISRTKVRFSKYIVKSSDSGERYRYQVKFINIGNRDLLEVICMVRLTVPDKKSNKNWYMKLGHYDMRPVLCGKKWQLKNSSKRSAWLLPIKMTDIVYKDFEKGDYPEYIQTAAREKMLTIEDVLKEYYPRAKIIIYVFGYDSVTGARRMFQSKPYTYEDIVKGKFYEHKDIKQKFMEYKKYVDHVLGIITDPPERGEETAKRDLKRNAPNRVLVTRRSRRKSFRHNKSRRKTRFRHENR